MRILTVPRVGNAPTLILGFPIYRLLYPTCFPWRVPSLRITAVKMAE